MKRLLLLPLSIFFLAACAGSPERAAPQASAGLLPGFEEGAGNGEQNGNGEALAAVELSTAASEAPITEQDIRDLEEGEEGGPGVIISTAPPEPPPPVNLGGNGKLTITRYDNREKLTVTYRDKKGVYDEKALAKINHIMRCAAGGEEAAIAVKLVELLDATEDKFGRGGILLLSGYRTQKYNSTLKGAAEHSMHVLGWAADIRIPGYSSTKIKKYGVKKNIGGVGYYPYSGFVHLDVGKVRYWAQARARRRRSRKKPAVSRTASPSKKAPPGKSGGKAAKKK